MYYCSGIRDFFGDMDAEAFEYVDFEGVLGSELLLTVDLFKQRFKSVPEVVSLLESFGGDGGDSDTSYEDEEDCHAGNSRGRHSKAKSRYLYPHVQ